MVRYTGYCTCFINEDKEVIFWDEINDKQIKVVKIENRQDGVELMKKWKAEAPKEVICDIIGDYNEPSIKVHEDYSEFNLECN